MHNLTGYATEQPFSGSGIKNFTHPFLMIDRLSAVGRRGWGTSLAVIQFLFSVNVKN